MNDSQRYADMICAKYGAKRQQLNKEYKTTGEVAIEVLPNDKLQQWLDDSIAETLALRKEFNVDIEVLRTVAELKAYYGK